ncbi:MAG: DedA family protein [Neisseriaceae bacterium]|nr:DedA family protein [Neisseriaceae bacterium]
MDFITLVFDYFLHLDVHLLELSQNYGPYIYLILFLIIFCETGLIVTPFLPGDSLLFMAGSIAALGEMNIYLMMGLLIVAAILGDTVNYAVGKALGAKLFSNPNSKIFKQSHLAKTHEFYEKHGGKTIIIARFVPIVRTFAPFVAGMGKMSYRKFLTYNVTGGIIWVLLFATAGYLFGNLEIVKKNLSLIMLGIIILSILPGVFEYVRHRKGSQKS